MKCRGSGRDRPKGSKALYWWGLRCRRGGLPRPECSESEDREELEGEDEREGDGDPGCRGLRWERDVGSCGAFAFDLPRGARRGPR